MSFTPAAEPSPPGSALDSSSTQGLARAQGGAGLEGMRGPQPSPPAEIIRSGKSLSDVRCERGKEQLERGVTAWGSYTENSFLDQLYPCKATSGTTRGPGTPSQYTKGEGASFLPRRSQQRSEQQIAELLPAITGSLP